MLTVIARHELETGLEYANMKENLKVVAKLKQLHVTGLGFMCRLLKFNQAGH